MHDTYDTGTWLSGPQHSTVCLRTASVLYGEECPCVSSADDDFHLERDARSASFRLADTCSCTVGLCRKSFVEFFTKARTIEKFTGSFCLFVRKILANSLRNVD
jgi:hypothetical protein